MSPAKKNKNAPPSADHDQQHASPATPSDATPSEPRARRPWFSYVLLLTAFVLTLYSGLLHGKLVNRHGLPAEALAGAERLKALPQEFGNWKVVAEYEPEKVVSDMLQCIGYQHRSYANQETGQVVSAVIIVGPTGPTTVHTPEICYSSRNYARLQERESVRIPGRTGELWATTFQSKDIDQSLLRVYWGWTFDGQWAAPDNTRWAHLGLPYLYKIQLASQLPPGTKLEESDPCLDFLTDFIPLLDRQQFK